MRTVFAGTPEFAVPALAALRRRPELELMAVYTQPDRPAGRGRRPGASPVKQAALAAGLSVRQPETLRSAEVLAAYQALAPELLVVAAYGLILPDAWIMPPLTAINVHASLLPRWRGAAPIQHALMAGDRETGISIMRVVARLDAGPVWLRMSCPIADTDTGGSLHDRLATLGAEALSAALDRLRDGTVQEEPQDERLATYARKLVAGDRHLDWSEPAGALERRVRALAPTPGATAHVGALDVKVLAAHVVKRTHANPPGTLLERSREHLLVAAATDALAITEVQPAGRQRMSAAAFLNGYGNAL